MPTLPTLKRGDKGTTVALLQTKLNARGYNCGQADGEFGKRTEQAVLLFQQHNSLKPDGVAGATTWEKLTAPPTSTEAARDMIGAQALADRYAAMFKSAKIKPERSLEVTQTVARLLENKWSYDIIAAEVPNVPWWAVGVLHNMECSLSFKKHLHNGDPLTARTVLVPAGRPKTGSPPFSFEFSAVDALLYDKFDKVLDWSIGSALDVFERYNGTGYRKRGVHSPYLWSFTNHYEKGKYVADGKYDPEAVSKQVGIAALLKEMVNVGAVVL